jgi:hypothetical protein
MAEARTHIYHSEATVLEGHLELPLVQQIYPQAYAKIPEEGGYLSQQHPGYRLEGVLSFENAYTQVAGNPDKKEGHGWNTLSTAVIEGLNVLDVLTADRVVAQLSTDHPLEGYTPTVSFLGTRFENLRIAGHPVKLHMNLDVLGPKPANDGSYIADLGVKQRAAEQLQSVKASGDASAEMSTGYNRNPVSGENPESMQCSLVNQVEGGFPGRCFGHVIDVPNFGKIYLATLHVEHSDPDPEKKVPKRSQYHLSMIEMHLGCIASGKVALARGIVNGTTNP